MLSSTHSFRYWGRDVTHIHQTTFGDGSDGTEPGNCMSACLASVLDVPLDDVPNFAAKGARYWDEMQRWLHARGLFLFELKVPPDQTPGTPDDLHYIASGVSPRGIRHAVIMREGRLVHDPHPSGTGLTTPPDHFYPIAKLT